MSILVGITIAVCDVVGSETSLCRDFVLEINELRERIEGVKSNLIIALLDLLENFVGKISEVRKSDASDNLCRDPMQKGAILDIFADHDGNFNF